MLLRPYGYEIEAKEYPGQIFERTNYTNGNKYWEKPIMDNATVRHSYLGKWEYVVRPLEKGW